MPRKKKYLLKLRVLAIVQLVVFLSEILFPTALHALTSGPSQPEFSSFEPIATTNMVNEFTGDFTYSIPLINIPGPNGSGYSMALSYHSGTTPEEESSWVGYGWTLNPGAINRNKRGVPDDWNGQQITNYSKSPKSQTVTFGGSGSLELFSIDPSIGINGSLRYNNYKGFGYTAGVGITVANGIASLGYNVSDGDGSFSLSINPAALMNSFQEKGDKSKDKLTKDKKIAKHRELANKAKESKSAKERLKNRLKPGAVNVAGSNFGLLTSNMSLLPRHVVKYTGNSLMFTAGILGTPSPLQLGISGNIFGSYAEQKNEEEKNLAAFGQMYLQTPGAPNQMLDYTTERDDPYQKRDYFLPIPFSSKDYFNVSGEGLGGSFQIQHKQVGYYGPRTVSSSIDIGNAGLEIEAGLNFGVGGDLGTGTQTLTVGSWHPENSVDWSWTAITANEDNIDEMMYFQFKGDMGSSLNYNNPIKQRANINGGIFNDYQPNLQQIDNTSNTNDWNETQAKRRNRASYIGFHNNSEITNYPGAYSKEDYGLLRSNANISSQIGEFAIYNEDGNLYTYGLPVYAMKEKTISLGMGGLSGVEVVNNHTAYINDDPENMSNFSVYNGTYAEKPYASTMLLTQITGPDYIDINNDGPDDLDYGSFTKFDYIKHHPNSSNEDYSSSDAWYKHRTPYRGLHYNKNQISDPKDDLATVSYGYKEIYYLDEISTKTHYARFITSARKDGHEAVNSESTAVNPSQINNPGFGSKGLQKLDYVEIYKKNDIGDDELIQRIVFKYDYSLCHGVPNNDEGTGKLTLKSVYTESGGLYNAYITPYEFSYTYPNPNDYPGIYNNLSPSVGDQNPTYSPFNIDPWGNYQHNGADRFADMKSWVNQNPEAAFDPAAWQLKNIKLPSGGEIHIQYEQDDYCYVQDQKAHMMAPLADNPIELHTGSTFTIDLSGFNLFPENDGSQERQSILDEINSRYVNGNERMYYKFLYKLIPGGSTPSLDNCNTDYIDGYAKVNAAFPSLTNSTDIVIVLNSSGGHDSPYKVCKDYVKKERAGMIPDSGDCDFTTNYVEEDADPLQTINQIGGAMGDLNLGIDKCVEMNKSLSYLRIPVGFKKLGGGIRVKRLLTFDPGNSADPILPVLYGNEYIYKTTDSNGNIISSGVATNEPSAIREENVLVTFLPFFHQSFASKIISGKDKRQTEGPLGESILPAPSVGYSKVIKKNIHTGQSRPAYSESIFHTAKDFPIVKDRTEIDNSNNENLPLSLGLINYLTNKSWVSQGYIFKTNEMHGQLQSSATYFGPCENAEAIFDSENTRVLRGLTINEYFAPGEQVPVVHDADIYNPDYFTYGTASLGTEMEVVVESRYTEDITDNGNIEGDLDVGTLGVLFMAFISAMPSLTHSITSMHTNVVNKIISYPSILKRTLVMQDGIYHATQHERFNVKNGKPVITRTHDGYREHATYADLLDLMESLNHEGIYKKYDIPTSFAYENSGQTSLNEGLQINDGNGLTITFGREAQSRYIEFTSSNSDFVCSLMSNYIAGDKLLIPFGSGRVYHVFRIVGNRLILAQTQQSANLSDLDPFNSTTITNVRTLRSGRNNKLNDVNFSFTTYPKNVNQLELFTVVDPLWAQYQSFVDALNQIVVQGGGTINIPQSVQLPPNLGLYDLESGSCHPISESTGVQINIANGLLNVSQTVQVESVLPGSTGGGNHPMVAALNNYINTFYGYELNSQQPPNIQYSCALGVQSQVERIIDNNDFLASMRDAQNEILNIPFDAVNGQNNVTIGQLFEDEGMANGFTDATYNLNTGIRENRRVRLIESSTSQHYGPGLDCSSNVGHFCVSTCKTTTSEVCQVYANQNNETLGYFTQDSEGYLVYNYVYVVNRVPKTGQCKTNVRFYRIQYETIDKPCTLPLPPNPVFVLNPYSAQIEVQSTEYPCYPLQLDCIQFCQGIAPNLWVENVVSSSSSFYSDNWFNGHHVSYIPLEQNFNYLSMGFYELGIFGKWRPKSTYVNESTIEGYANAQSQYQTPFGKRNYNSGMYDMPVFNFQWETANHPSWKRLNTITMYNLDGNALESQNILDVKSAALYGYNQVVPYLTATNAAYHALLFESFETLYNFSGNDRFENGFIKPTNSVIINDAHLGKKSLDISEASFPFSLKTLDFAQNEAPEGLRFKVWYKSSRNEKAAEDLKIIAEHNTQNYSASTVGNFKVIGQSGEWFLAECTIDYVQLQSIASSAILTNIELYFNYHQPSFASTLIIDDLLIQPMFAQINAHVYDTRDFKLLATLDDQHYATLYQYNASNQLIRHKKETDRGIKTIKEVQYNTPMTPKQ